MRWDRPANSDALGLVADHFRGLFLISDTWAILGAQAYIGLKRPFYTLTPVHYSRPLMNLYNTYYFNSCFFIFLKSENTVIDIFLNYRYIIRVKIILYKDMTKQCTFYSRYE